MDLADQDDNPDVVNGDPTPGQGDPTPGEGDGDSKTFTQEQVNALVAREASKAARGKLDPKELGFESAKEMKDFVDQAKGLLEEQKSEAEKELESRVKLAREEATAEVLGRAKQIALKAEFKVQAVQAGVVDPDGAFLLAQTLEGWDEIQVADDGSVTGLDEEFFKAMKETKSYLFSKDESSEEPKTTSISPGASGGGDMSDARTKELAQKYPVLGRLGLGNA